MSNLFRSPVKSSAPDTPNTPPNWKKPDDVMKLHRLKIKKNALAARMNGEPTSNNLWAITKSTSPQSKSKRKNPFTKRVDVTTTSPLKKKTKNEIHDKNDESLFQLLGLKSSEPIGRDFSFLNIAYEKTSIKSDETFNQLPIDWTLRSKLRFLSLKQYPWTETLKTCEEASGITGFVRCIGSGGGGCAGLDTSPNANFHHCCLYWQHPNLPWLELFPRTKLESKVPNLATHQTIKDSLHQNWCESFASIFQLLRARHCPYFYLISNYVNCLFRAAGINGCTETNVIVSPTTCSFRRLLVKDGIDFTRPLKPPEAKADEKEISDEMLEKMGINKEVIKNINKNEEKLSYEEEIRGDGQDDSLIYIQGNDIHAFFNFIYNCASLTPSSGPLTGIPPTLLSPIAFCGGTLMNLNARHSKVKIDNEVYQSLELIGPIMPHTVHNFCSILNSIDFSVTFSTVRNTKAFTKAILKQDSPNDVMSPGKVGRSGQAFSEESLNDCGLKTNILSQFCSENVHLFETFQFSKGSYIVQ